MENNFCVYRHIRPDKDEVFYIGKAQMGSKRPKNKASRKHNNIWKAIVDKNNGEYGVEVMLDNLTEQEAFEKEIEFIKLYGRKDLGEGTLANMTYGGEGPSGRFHKEESKRMMSKSHMGKTISLETRKRLSIAGKGRVITKEHKEKLRQSNLGQKRSESSKKNLSESLKNMDTEIRNKVTQANIKDKGIKVICNETGKVFISIKEASNYTGINYSTLMMKLRGAIKNNTTLTYYEN